MATGIERIAALANAVRETTRVEPWHIWTCGLAAKGWKGWNFLGHHASRGDVSVSKHSGSDDLAYCKASNAT